MLNIIILEEKNKKKQTKQHTPSTVDNLVPDLRTKCWLRGTIGSCEKCLILLDEWANGLDTNGGGMCGQQLKGGGTIGESPRNENGSGAVGLVINCCGSTSFHWWICGIPGAGWIADGKLWKWPRTLRGFERNLACPVIPLKDVPVVLSVRAV